MGGFEQGNGKCFFQVTQVMRLIAGHLALAFALLMSAEFQFFHAYFGVKGHLVPLHIIR